MAFQDENIELVGYFTPEGIKLLYQNKLDLKYFNVVDKYYNYSLVNTFPTTEVLPAITGFDTIKTLANYKTEESYQLVTEVINDSEINPFFTYRNILFNLPEDCGLTGSTEASSLVVKINISDYFSYINTKLTDRTFDDDFKAFKVIYDNVIIEEKVMDINGDFINTQVYQVPPIFEFETSVDADNWKKINSFYLSRRSDNTLDVNVNNTKFPPSIKTFISNIITPNGNSLAGAGKMIFGLAGLNYGYWVNNSEFVKSADVEKNINSYRTIIPAVTHFKYPRYVFIMNTNPLANFNINTLYNPSEGGAFGFGNELKYFNLLSTDRTMNLVDLLRSTTENFFTYSANKIDTTLYEIKVNMKVTTNSFNDGAKLVDGKLTLIFQYDTNQSNWDSTGNNIISYIN